MQRILLALLFMALLTTAVFIDEYQSVNAMLLLSYILTVLAGFCAFPLFTGAKIIWKE